MGKCFLANCKHRSERNVCRFFRFPASPAKRKKWLRALNRSDGKEPSRSSYVCSCHFPDESRLRTPSSNKLFNRTSPTSCNAPLRQQLDVTASLTPRRQTAVCALIDLSQVVVTTSEQSDVRSTSPWKVSGFPSAPTNRTEGKSPVTARQRSARRMLSMGTELPRDSVDNLVARDDVTDDTNQSLEGTSPSDEVLVLERQSLQEELNKLCAEREVDKQYFDCVITEKEALHSKVSSLQEQKEGVVQDFIYCTLEKVDYFLRCRELESQLKICNDEKKALEQQRHKLSQDLCLLQSSFSGMEKLYSDTLKEKTTLSKENLSQCEKILELSAELTKAKQDLDMMLKVSDVLKRENRELKENVAKMKTFFTFPKFCNDKNISHYCGLYNVNTFYWLLSMLPQDLKYYMGCKVDCLSREDQLCLTLLKLRQNVSHELLKDMFHVSQYTVSNVFLTWLSALHSVLVRGLMRTVPSLKKVQRSMPAAFSKYPNCRIIIDCTEVEVEIPGLMSPRNKVHSSYKSKHTFKGLVAFAPNGTVVFASKLFPGSTSDRTIVEECGILQTLEPGDAVMADKGFTINDILPSGVTLNLPPFKETPQFTQAQVIETLQKARSRIHVERAIQRTKLFHILDYIPHSEFQFSTEIFQVCAALTNFGAPLIKEVEDLMRCTD